MCGNSRPRALDFRQASRGFVATAMLAVERMLFSLLLLLAALGLIAAGQRDARAQAPNFVAAGAGVGGTNGVSPAWPAHQAGDIALLFMETRGNVTPTLSTANGFASVGSNNAVNSAAGTRLTVYWARATSDSMAAPVIANTTDHVYARILTYRGVLWSGNPWNATATGNKTTASNVASVTGVTPTETNSLIVQAISRPNDSTAAFIVGTPTNANLTGIAVRSDAGTDVGDGGGLAVWDGVRATAAATGNTAANLNVSVVNAFRALALRPARYYSRVANGNWNAAATWSTAPCGGVQNAASIVPPAGADVTICGGHTVTLNQNSANLKSLTIQVTGILLIGNSGTARTLNVSPAAPLPAGSIVNNGTLRYNTAGNHSITTNGTFTNNGTFESLAGVAGTRALTVTGLITNSSTGTFRFAGNAITTVNANGGFTNDGTINVDANSNVTHVLNMRGNFVNNSNNVSFRADANSLVNTVFNATVAQTVTGSVANTDFGNVTVSNALGVTLTGTHNMTVLNTLNFTVNGAIITTGSNLVQIGSQSLDIAGNVTNANANRFVDGNLQRYFTAAGTFNFDVGSTGPNRYSPVQVQLGVAPSADGSLRVSTNSGDHAQIGSSGFDAAKTVNRTWTLTNAGLVFAANANNRVRFTFVAGDIDGGAVTANFHIGRYTGPWTLTPPPAPNAQPLFTEMSGTTITSAVLAGDFQVGEKTPVVTAPDSFNAVEVSGAINGRLFTKLAGVNFTLDIVAIQGGIQQASFGSGVTIDLVTGGSAGANCGGASVTTVWGPTDVTLSGGRVTTGNINVAIAYPDVRMRMRYPVGGPYTVTTCSSDNFTIRPQSFSVGSASLNNSGTTGGANAKAGSTFSIEATAAAGYNGTPAISLGSITAHAGATATGTLAGSFGAANAMTGISTGSFTYSEVGNFTINSLAVSDSNFAGGSGDIAGGDCISAAVDPSDNYSNTLIGGKYGCFFRNPAASSVIGRFTPDHFIVTPGTVINRHALSCAIASTFTYEGEELRVGFLVTARNGLVTPTTTENYTTASGFAQLVGTVPGNFGIGVVDLADATLPTAGTALTSRLTLGSSSGTWTKGAMAATVDLSINRAASPDGPFESFRIGALPVDADGITLRTMDLDLDTTVPADTADRGRIGSSIIRFGRLQIGNANGSQLVPLSLPMEAQYWNSLSFVTNAADSCTSLDVGNVGLGNYTGSLDSGETTPTIAAGAFVNGRKTLVLSAPGAANSGSVDVVLNLGTTTTIDSCLTWTPSAPTPSGAGRAHLRGRWCGATHTKDPTARARFGVVRGSEEVIHTRESFQ